MLKELGYITDSAGVAGVVVGVFGGGEGLCGVAGVSKTWGCPAPSPTLVVSRPSFLLLTPETVMKRREERGYGKKASLS